MTKWASACERNLAFDVAFCKELQDVQLESKYLSPSPPPFDYLCWFYNY